MKILRQVHWTQCVSRYTIDYLFCWYIQQSNALASLYKASYLQKGQKKTLSSLLPLLLKLVRVVRAYYISLQERLQVVCLKYHASSAYRRSTKLKGK